MISNISRHPFFRFTNESFGNGNYLTEELSTFSQMHNFLVDVNVICTRYLQHCQLSIFDIHLPQHWQ